jgi:purine-binding chemotaxis protein CheW
VSPDAIEYLSAEVELKTTKPLSGPGQRPKPAAGQPAKAVDEFLESLLEPVQEYHPAQEQQLAQKIEPQKKRPLAEPLPKVRLPEHLTKPKVEVVSQTAVEVKKPKPLSSFFDHPFQCLLFRTLGSEFAVPLASLSGILSWDGQATKLPGQPAWHRGVMPYREGKIGLVDLDNLLGVRPLEEGPKAYILAFAEGRFGLLCKELLPPRTLSKDDVKWRENRDDRPWSLGTLREQLCPLLDLDEVEAMLH